MNIQWWEVVGLIGVTLVITAGRIFESLREWLLTFEKPYNPFRIAGELLRCSMCCGIWVGFLWGVLVKQWPWYVALVLGGCISIASITADELIGILSLYRLLRKKREKGALTMDELLAARQQSRVVQKQRQADQMSQARARKRGTPRELTEEEADAYVDAQERAIDALITGEPDEAA